MSNSTYLLQGSIETGELQSEGKAQVLGEKAPIVRIGFPSKKEAIPFTFSLFQTLIDFGPLSPTNPVMRTTRLTISHGSAIGFSVLTFADHELRDETTSALIPDINCDASSCTHPLTYGFGYRCNNLQGSDCEKDFAQAGLFKPFAHPSKGESGVVLKSPTWGRNASAEITHRVNIAGAQKLGVYSNTITFVAVPNF